MDPEFDLPEAPAERKFPWIGVLVGAVFLGMVALGAGTLHGSPERLRREVAVAELERELDAEQAALRDQRDKVVAITQRLDALKQAILLGQVPNKKKAAAEYGRLVNQQHAERAAFAAMAARYNAKVAQQRSSQ